MRLPRQFVFAAAVLLALFSAPAITVLPAAQAQPPSLLPAPSGSPAEDKPFLQTEEGVKAARVALEHERSEVNTQLLQAQAGANPPAAERLSRELEQYSVLDLLYLQQLSALQRSSELESEQKRLIDEQRSAADSAAAAADFQALEQLRDQLRFERERLIQEEENAKAAASAAEEAAAGVETKESARRRAKEELNIAPDAAARADREWTHRLTVLESRVQKQLAQVRAAELKAVRLSAEVIGMKAALLEQRIAALKPRVKMQESDLSAALTQLDEREKAHRQRLEEVKAILSGCERRYFEAKKRLAGNVQPDPLLDEELEAQRVCRAAAQEEMSVIGARISMIFAARDVWNRRLQVHKKQYTAAQLKVWREEVEQLIDASEQRRRMQNLRQTDLRAEVKRISSWMDAARADPGVVQWIGKQRAPLRRIESMYGEYIEENEQLRSLAEKFKTEIVEQQSARRLREGLQTFGHAVSEIWNYEILSVDDHPITIKKILIALIIVVLGFRLSYSLSRKFAQKVAPRVGLKPGEAAAFEALVFYGLVVFFVLFALQLVHVPLTVFTLLGGAVAIGVGFGSQNIMNNFISGLILLMERPIRTGDLVEVDGLQGRVLRIGARSTRIITFNNIDLVVPNSMLLEKTVINWTLSDAKARSRITVGTAYGSDPELVKRLLIESVISDPDVLPEPKPYAVLSEFGDSAMLFYVYFWISLEAERIRPVVESDIRCRIDALFRQHGIVIPFPQRSVTVGLEQPLDVRVIER